jgi:mannose-6-phosphate isomerase-like protein (cupin superfamily)
MIQQCEAGNPKSFTLHRGGDKIALEQPPSRDNFVQSFSVPSGSQIRKICIARNICIEEQTMSTNKAKVVGPCDGKAGFLGSIGVRSIIDGVEAGERFSLVEHPMGPRALAAPLHRHNREDEYSFVLEGRMGALLGDEVLEAGPGDLVFKPRKQWHTFWNAGDEPCRILEIISPAGFERFFMELIDLGGVSAVAPQVMAELCARYELEMRPDSVPELIERFNVRFPGESIPAGWPNG